MKIKMNTWRVLVGGKHARASNANGMIVEIFLLRKKFIVPRLEQWSSYVAMSTHTHVLLALEWPQSTDSETQCARSMTRRPRPIPYYSKRYRSILSHTNNSLCLCAISFVVARSQCGMVRWMWRIQGLRVHCAYNHPKTQ